MTLDEQIDAMTTDEERAYLHKLIDVMPSGMLSTAIQFLTGTYESDECCGYCLSDFEGWVDPLTVTVLPDGEDEV